MSGTPSEIFEAVLNEALSRDGGKQIFVFGPDGTPFWAARLPTSVELNTLEVALRLIEELEHAYPKPFFARGPHSDFLVAALDVAQDLYIVVIGDDLSPVPAEIRVAAWRSDLRPYLGSVRDQIRKAVGE